MKDNKAKKEYSSVEFNWEKSDIEMLLATCQTDDVLQYIEKYLNKEDKLLESGCGTGRWVRYLHDQGFDITGLDLSQSTVEMVNNYWPDLKIMQGNSEDSPFPENTFDGVISLGVVEHWPEGPEKPLKDIFRILKKGGLAIITVPCLNNIRQIKTKLYWNEIRQAPIAALRYLIKGMKFKVFRFHNKYRYAVFPAIGEFFEYRMTPEEYAKEVKNVGFNVLEHKPLADMYGLYYEINPFNVLIKCKDWILNPTKLAIYLNNKMKEKDFMHCHMQIMVVRK